jgi:hypothetical protein
MLTEYETHLSQANLVLGAVYEKGQGIAIGDANDLSSQDGFSIRRWSS